MREGVEIAVVRTGLANLASVLAGFRRVGARPFITENPADVDRCDYVVLPGVGAFGWAMKHLEKNGLVEPLQQRIRDNRATMSVCVGHQLLCESSEESPGVKGLSVVPARVGKFPDKVRVPQLGWNYLDPEGETRFLKPGYAYFANSFCIQDNVPEGWTAAYATHGVRFVAAMESGNLLSCQFHPELSGQFGLDLLKRWLSQESGGAA